ncbi:ParB/RepB/Spo0J family partition protein [Phytoactinopolyspora alkaliphila]|uniref:ParB/RepB/Spo0J family partition protein n=1 Tax=Phytoactinopolyspora alkaliphila TaxID=1783498 RepID=A0A6N9YNQ3_9ACTN|nr:ParB/RepB/Spo0J family partition protein [Phytoactinopolyspora alkaliphila]NED96469.1 ParB/RepB/Spo0J family partition protein [Phytoactinopolyspora alkaliphila]
MNATTIERLALEKVRPHPANVRLDVGDLTELADSIDAKGLLQPILVAPDPEIPGMWVIIAGHRRHAAATLVGLNRVDCVIRHDLTSEADIIEAMLVENLQRSDLTPVEEATAYQRLALFDVSPAEIARRTGRAESTVRRRLDLMRLPETTRELVHDGQLTLGQADAIAEFTDDPDMLDRLAATSAADMDATIYALRHQRDRQRRNTELVTEVESAGGKVYHHDGATDIPAGARRVDEWTLSMTPAQHRKHHPTGHAIVVWPHYVQEYCLDPTVHGVTTEPAPQPAPTVTDEKVAARAAEEQRLADDLAGAREHRIKWIRGTLSARHAPKPAGTEAMLRQFVLHLLEADLFDVTDWCDLLGLDVDLESPDVALWIASEVLEWRTPRLA